MKQSAFFILNAAAGRGRGHKLRPRLTQATRDLGWDARIHETTHSGHERELGARAREEEWPLVVAVGGDGTVHHTANGLLAEGPTETALGHVPIGTGNDYAFALGLRKRPFEHMLNAALHGTVRSLDVGNFMGQYFVNALGAGFDAEATRQSLSIKHLRGFPLYLTAAYRTFIKFDPPELEVVAPEHHERARVMMMEVAIGPSIGGGFKIAPGAIIDDGLFDVCVIRRVGLLRFLRYVPRVVRGKHTEMPDVALFRSSDVQLNAPSGPVLVHLDGELFELPEGEPQRVEMLPQHLKVVCAH
jgi:YegS/Rv2252/BmrU family lipid kinase